MPSVPDDLLRKLIEHAISSEHRADPDDAWIAEALALLPENRPDITSALTQYADEPAPASLFLRDATNWTRPLTRTS